MRAFACTHCGWLVHFANTECLRCGFRLAYDPDRRELLAFPPDAPPVPCANARAAGCNWLAPAPGELCASCRLTRTRPADDDAPGLAGFARAEAAKRLLLFELGELGLPVTGFQEREGALAFDLLSSEHEPVSTGHADGLITLDLAESDDARREQRRQQLGEPYRTLLGHMRHEVGHYYWTVLAPDDARRERARALLGDEREDYGEALERHYEHGPPTNWAQDHVSAYATMHPAEDWAETFAHYLHLRDTLQTAAAYRVRVATPEAVAAGRDEAAPRADELDARATGGGTLVAPPAADGADRADGATIEQLLDAWLPLTYALNALNRSMGRDDLYPFVLPGPVVEKLGLVHDLVREVARGTPSRATDA